MALKTTITAFTLDPIKLEKIIIEMKTKLEAIEQELKNLSKKEEKKVGWWLQFSFECRHFCSNVKEFVTLCTMNRDLLILSDQ